MDRIRPPPGPRRDAGPHGGGDDLRRVPRLSACCRVTVRQSFGVWTAVTRDLSARGCHLLTHQLPGLATLLHLRLSSDLIPEDLDVVASVVWASRGRVGLVFLPPPGSARPASPPAGEWVERVREAGRSPGSPGGVVPAIVASGPSRPRRERDAAAR